MPDRPGAGSDRSPEGCVARPRIGVGGFRTTPRARELVLQVLESHRLSSGPMMARFEREVAALHGRAHGLMCNSGTSALQIALAALKERYDWQDGDEVLVPAITFIATVNVALYNGLPPVFVDVDPRYYTMDPACLAAKITPRTRAIVPVHIAGLPCDMDPILEVARAHNLRLVEDSCEVGGCPIIDLEQPVAGPMRFRCDMRTIHTLIDWRPRYSIEEGLRRAYEVMKSLG